MEKHPANVLPPIVNLLELESFRITNQTKKSIAIIGDDRSLKEQFFKWIICESSVDCCGNYTSAEEALPQVFKRPPDIIILESNLPGISGMECLDLIRKKMPAVRTIMVMDYEEHEHIFQALKAGASGYLVKSDPPVRLLESIRNTCAGGSLISGPVALKVLQYIHKIDAPANYTKILSPKEALVLDLLAMGFIYKEIGTKLNIGMETVRTHVKRICRKMHVRSRIEAVAGYRSETFVIKSSKR